MLSFWRLMNLWLVSAAWAPPFMLIHVIYIPV